MLEMTQRQRAIRVLDEVGSILHEQAGSAICVDNIEILFEPSLHVDALRLLQSIAKQHTLVVAWPGRFDGTRLLYATKDHPEYREYASDGLSVISIGQT